MIRTFRHKGLQVSFETGSKAGIQPAHAKRLARQLHALDRAAGPEEMDVPGWRLRPLTGLEFKGYWAVWVNGNWRVTFLFQGRHAFCVDYLDYH